MVRDRLSLSVLGHPVHKSPFPLSGVNPALAYLQPRDDWQVVYSVPPTSPGQLGCTERGDPPELLMTEGTSVATLKLRPWWTDNLSFSPFAWANMHNILYLGNKRKEGIFSGERQGKMRIKGGNACFSYARLRRGAEIDLQGREGCRTSFLGKLCEILGTSIVA